MVGGILVLASLQAGAFGGDGASGVSRDEVRAVAARVMADAETRSSLLLGEESRVGWLDGRFRIRGDDPDFWLSFGMDVQFRYFAAFRSGHGEANEFGFQARRTRLDFRGQVVEGLGFRVLFASDRADGTFTPDYAYVRHEWGPWRLRWGIFKVPFMREEDVSATAQLAVDRSLVNEIFNQDFAELVELTWMGESWRFAGAFSDGFGSITTFIDEDKPGAFEDGESEWALTGRAEWKPVGEWSALRDFTSTPGSETTILLGAAAHWESGDASDGRGSYHGLSVTGDVSLEGDGWNAFASVVWRHIDAQGGDPTTDDLGIVVQGGAFLPGTDVELFGRYDVYLPDPDEEGDDPFNTVTLGGNWYVHGQSFKLTVDVQWFIDDVSGTDFRSLSRSTGIGFLSSDDPNEVVIRTQIQFEF